jgi:prolyl-tRNA synthetase
MRWSSYFIPTLREVPADAEVISHKLLLRAGMVRQLSAGLYSYLPTAQRSVLRIAAIIREEMEAVGAQEFFLTALNPAELWQESGRWALMGDDGHCAAGTAVIQAVATGLVSDPDQVSR